MIAAKNVHTEKSTKDRTRTVRDGLPIIELGFEVSGFLFVCIFSDSFRPYDSFFRKLWRSRTLVLSRSRRYFHYIFLCEKYAFLTDFI